MRGSEVVKRLLVGRPLRSDLLEEHTLPVRLALPIFASDPLSSVAYATEQILLVLTLGGLAFLHLTPYVAAAIVVLLAVVIASYRQTVHAYPGGGGAYQVARHNLGRWASLAAASALLVDYVLTVAVSVAAGVAAITSAAPSLYPHATMIAIGCIVVLAAINLHGARESGRAFALPTYGFVLGVLVMIAVGLARVAVGHPPVAESAHFGVRPAASYAGLALVFLGMRAFASGCTALTGVEAISNGVPAFRRPKSANAARALLLLGALSIMMFAGITVLALVSHVHIVENPGDLIGAHDVQQRTAIAQIAAAVFGGHTSFGFLYLQVFTAAILILAANTAFNGFPVLASILAQDRFLPRQLHTRGDRLVFSNGIVLLSLFAIALLWAFHASTTRLIQLYIIGVFVSFTLSQAGMVVHWTKLLRQHAPGVSRTRLRGRRVLNGVGATLTGIVLVVVLVTKFLGGAWIVTIAMPLLYLLMLGINRHYRHISEELAVDPDDQIVRPSRNYAVVLVSKLHKPTMRALSYASSTNPHRLIALTVEVDQTDTDVLREQWESHNLPYDLVILDSPYREITNPIVNYVKGMHREGPRDVITVYIPEYVVGHWWEQILHNQSALRLKLRLLFQPGVMVTSVPWHLTSSIRRHRNTGTLAHPRRG